MLRNASFLEEILPVKGLDPVADFSDTAQSGDIVSLRGHEKFVALIYKGVGASGTSTITVEGCDTIVPGTATAVAFRYREFITANLDTAGAIKSATSAGFTTTAGSSQLYVVEIDAEALLALGFNFVRVTMTEVVNSPVLGGIVYLMCGAKFRGAGVPASVIS